MNLTTQLMHITCRDTSAVISEMVDHPVSPAKYWRAKIHLVMCRVCRYYENQLKILTQLTYKLADKNSPTKIDFALSPESKPPMKKTPKSKTHQMYSLNKEKLDEWYVLFLQ